VSWSVLRGGFPSLASISIPDSLNRKACLGTLNFPRITLNFVTIKQRMRITTAMLQELEQSIAPDAKAEIRVYAGGCDIRVRWDKGMKEVNQNLGAAQLAQIEEYREEKMGRVWDRLIRKFQGLRDQGSNKPN